MRHPKAIAGALLIQMAVTHAMTRAQLPGHLACYSLESSQRVEGLVDIDAGALGLAPGCTIRSARLLCTEAAATFRAVTVDGEPVTPVPPDVPPPSGQTVCYKIKCPKPHPQPREVRDELGARTVKRLHPSLLCAPVGNPASTTSSTTTTTSSTTLPGPPCGPIPGLFDCASDGDCVVADGIGCCSCTMGGSQVAVNRERAPELTNQLSRCCRGTACIALFDCSNVRARCEAGRCILAP
jgi:hypothetical protein